MTDRRQLPHALTPNDEYQALILGVLDDIHAVLRDRLPERKPAPAEPEGTQQVRLKEPAAPEADATGGGEATAKPAPARTATKKAPATAARPVKGR